jgi:mono/diheme cytochrome c family protein
LIPDGRETLAGAASPASRAAAMAIGAFAVAWMLGSASAAPAPAIPGALSFTEKHCASCHNDVDKEGGFDIASLKFAPDAPGNAQRWVLVHDRVKAGEMPPKEKQRPDGGDLATFVQSVATALTEQERIVTQQQGRTTQRRLNRYEFENALRDLLHAPWLQVKGDLPEDGEAELFNKVGDVLDV